jgi:hypothetical protein
MQAPAVPAKGFADGIAVTERLYVQPHGVRFSHQAIAKEAGAL